MDPSTVSYNVCDEKLRPWLTLLQYILSVAKKILGWYQCRQSKSTEIRFFSYHQSKILDFDEQFKAKFSVVKMTTNTFKSKSVVILKLLT